jgi:3'5'-cyclic nucleotide phosphodiesterase
VTLAMDKLLCRMMNDEKFTDLELHLLTFGISSDPLTQFAMVFASLIHDGTERVSSQAHDPSRAVRSLTFHSFVFPFTVGHSGITNAQLVAEEADVAVKYREKSVAEQNALCVGWAVLMHSRHKRLRCHLYKTNVERKRFRQVLINAVMATDIADREVILGRARKWKRAFQEDDDDAEGDVEAGRGGGNLALRKDERNRRATVVIEALIQVADVAPTMQHWSIWRRWNQKLFEEMYAGYMNGRASFDPTAIWLRGELAFFDYFVIPLAQKIDDCGVFGPAGDQYLEYAMANRDGWEQHGEEELREMIEAARMIEPDMNSSRLLQSYSSGFSGSPEASKQEDSQSQDVATFAGSSIDFGFDQYTEHSDIDSTFKTVTSELNKSRLSKEEIEEIYAEAGNPPPPPFNSPDKGGSRAISRQLSAKLSSRALAHARLERSTSSDGGAALGAATSQAPPGFVGGPLDVESSPSRNRFAAESPTKRSNSTQSTSTSHHRNLSKHSSSHEPPSLPHRQPTTHSTKSSTSSSSSANASRSQPPTASGSAARAEPLEATMPKRPRHESALLPSSAAAPSLAGPSAAAEDEFEGNGGFQTHRVSL